MTTTSPAAPSRYEMIDSLRGFALMGLFIVHAVEYFELYWYKYDSKIVDPIHNWVFGLFAGKAFAMFALMFGLSFFIIMDRSAKKGVDFSGRFVWRLVVLFILGFFHALFYGGEVLQVLALCGLVLVPLNRLSWKWLLPLAIACFAQPVLWVQMVRAIGDISANVSPASWSYPSLELYAHGSFADVVTANLFPKNKWDFMWEAGRIFQIFGLFFVGLMLGRAGFFTSPEKFATARRLGFLLALGVAVGLHFARPMVNAAIPGDDAHFLVGWARDNIFDSYQALAGMFMWVFGFVELYQWSLTRPVQSLLAPMGRMTLTLYVMQSVLCTPLYYGYGLGWYQSIGQTKALAFGIAFFLAQMLFAHLWFRRFHYGPLEWVWRAATYLTTKVPFVRSKTVAAD